MVIQSPTSVIPGKLYKLESYSPLGVKAYWPGRLFLDGSDWPHDHMFGHDAEFRYGEEVFVVLGVKKFDIGVGVRLLTEDGMIYWWFCSVNVYYRRTKDGRESGFGFEEVRSET